jgi:hypothetical protein
MNKLKDLTLKNTKIILNERNERTNRQSKGKELETIFE